MAPTSGTTRTVLSVYAHTCVSACPFHSNACTDAAWAEWIEFRFNMAGWADIVESDVDKDDTFSCIERLMAVSRPVFFGNTTTTFEDLT